jgi:hypothetical protein
VLVFLPSISLMTALLSCSLAQALLMAPTDAMAAPAASDPAARSASRRVMPFSGYSLMAGLLWDRAWTAQFGGQ